MLRLGRGFNLHEDLLDVTLPPFHCPEPSTFPSANACSSIPAIGRTEVPEFAVSSQLVPPKLLETLGSHGKNVDTGFYH